MNRQLSLFDFLFSPPASAIQMPLPLATKKKDLLIQTKNPSLKTIAPKSPFQEYSKVLMDYLPAESLENICDTLAKHNVFLKITKKRQTKLGDYRSPQTHPPFGGRGGCHRITINHDLNKYSFLITLVHELAHLTTWEEHKRKVKPHGNEWKNEFREIMLPFISKGVFPDEIVSSLNKYLLNPAASSCTDISLLKTLRKFDIKNHFEKIIHLEDIPENAIFTLTGKSKRLRKGKKLRKRFLCNEINSKRKFLVSPVAEVIVVE